MDLSELEVRKSDADKNKPFHRFDRKIDPRPGYVPSCHGFAVIQGTIITPQFLLKQV